MGGFGRVWVWGLAAPADLAEGDGAGAEAAGLLEAARGGPGGLAGGQGVVLGEVRQGLAGRVLACGESFGGLLGAGHARARTWVSGIGAQTLTTARK